MQRLQCQQQLHLRVQRTVVDDNSAPARQDSLERMRQCDQHAGADERHPVKQVHIGSHVFAVASGFRTR